MAYQSLVPSNHFDELCAFVAVIEARGFSAAARSTGGRKATLSQRVQALEARLGVSLLVRTTRSLRLTDEGRAYYEHARRSLSAARDADAVVLSAKSEPTGTLRITSSAALTSGLLEHVITLYLVTYPKTAVYLDTSDARLDLVREGYDLAIRAGALGDSSMIARKLGELQGGYFVGRQYVFARGVPNHPDQLAHHDAIVTPKGDGPTEWTFLVAGKQRAYQVRPRLRVASDEAAVRAAVASLGIVRAPLHLVAAHLEERTLLPVLRDWMLPAIDVHAVYPPGGALVPKTRAFLDLLTSWFQDRDPGQNLLSPPARRRARHS